MHSLPLVRCSGGAVLANEVPGLLQQLDDLLVGGLGEVEVPLADPEERLWSHDAYGLVHFPLEFTAGGKRGGRNGHGDPSGPVAFERQYRGAHAGPRGQPIVHEDGRLALQFERGPVAAIEALAALQFRLLSDGDGIDLALVQPGRPHHVVVQHPYSTTGDGPERKFLLPGHPELADHVDVERSPQGFGDLEGHHDAAPRQPQDDQVVAAFVGSQLLCQYPPGVAAIGEDTHLSLPFARSRSAPH